MNSDRHTKSACVGIAGMIAAGLAFLAGNGCGQHQDTKFENSRYSALGEIVAAKVNELGGGKGRLVLVVAERDNNQPTAFGQIVAAFRKTLDKSFQVSVETVVTSAVAFSGSDPLSVDKFTALLQNNADADYLISFVGVPVLTPVQIDQLPSPRPPVVEVVAYNPPTKAMFAKKVVCLAALNKPAAQGSDATGSSLEIFDACYQLASPETAVSLPR
jgi:hypothetical protein